MSVCVVMAPKACTFCVKCKLKIENRQDKVLKCYGICKNSVHYSCSAFKHTELKLFEIHNNNTNNK